MGKERLHWRPLTNPSLPRPTNLTVGFFFLRINWFRFGAVSLEGWCAHRLRYAAGLGEAAGTPKRGCLYLCPLAALPQQEAHAAMIPRRFSRAFPRR